MVLDAALLNSQHYKVRIKDKVELAGGMELHPPLHLGVVAILKEAFGSLSTMVANFLYVLTEPLPIYIYMRFLSSSETISIEIYR